MESIDISSTVKSLQYGENIFHELMRWRIRRILLVLPHYDAWILEYDAKLSEQIVGEYHQLNLTTVPRLITVPDGKMALELLAEKTFELMIIGMRVGEMHPYILAREAKKLQPELVALLLYPSRSDLAALPWNPEMAGAMDASFLWGGDSRLLLAMIKFVEDMKNAPSDTKEGLVGVLLVVEDSVPFYSVYLPLLYGEVMRQTQRLIAEEMNDTDKYYRMRTRPKVLLARHWEEAVSLTKRYGDVLLGVISDIEFRRNGEMDSQAGFLFLEDLRKRVQGVPVLLQSSDAERREEAYNHGTSFQTKGARDLLKGIRKFLLEEMGFGDFVFRDPQGRESHRVKTLRGFEKAVEHLPGDVLTYHGARNNYSMWLGAHGEHLVAKEIRPVHFTDFPNTEAYRDFLVRSFRKVRERRHRGRLVDFHADDPGIESSLARIGSGSLGGKGRGLAFFSALLAAEVWEKRYPRFSLRIPWAVILSTSEFDLFMETVEMPPHPAHDREVRQAFLRTPLAPPLVENLKDLITNESGPLAIRSSSLLEDSQALPFAGIYDTFMISGEEDKDIRLAQLMDAIRLVWASVFYRAACAYREALGVGQEEEKMAVVIQRIAGSPHGDYFYPRISGTAQSTNYYPIEPMARQDGAARIVLGLGLSVVQGERGYFFCPRHPTVPYGTQEDRWRKGQSHFWALRLGNEKIDLSQGERATLEKLTVRDAEKQGVLRHLASTWDHDGRRICDGLESPGPRILDFKDILVYDWLPLAPLLGDLLLTARKALGTSVELEFAVDWEGDVPQNAVFSLLQVRPLSSLTHEYSLVPEPPLEKELFLQSECSLGHGVLYGIQDILWVDPTLYDSTQTETYQALIASYDKQLAAENRHAIVLGPGRWGSRDRFLGIPVSWSQISQAKLIVEVAQGEGDPEPSQGSHFFHNLVACGVGYAHVSQDSKQGGFVDWAWLRSQSEEDDGVVRHARLENPLSVIMDGRNGRLWVPKK